MKKSKKIIAIIIFIIVLIIITLLYIFSKNSLAEYIESNEYKYNYSGSKMYISSNLLTDDGAYQLTIDNYDYSQIPFKVYNYKSDSQISTRNIVYGITCTTSSSNYLCSVDSNDNNSITNQRLASSYVCSISTYSESQCARDETATLTYNKKTKNHYIKVKKISGSDATSLTITITLTTTSPYIKTLTRELNLKFDNTNKSVVIETVGESDYQCEYLISNYIDRSDLFFNTNSNTSYFMDNKGHTIGVNIPKYTNKIIKIYKKKTTSCNGAILALYY